MTVTINLIENITSEINQDILRSAIQMTLNQHEQPDDDITLFITDDQTIQRLNHDYRGFDITTDVLAFNQDFLNPETNRYYLGDIILSIQQAHKQAVENNHSLTKECVLLTIHGTLHLLGYDHNEDEQKSQMWKMQDAILYDLFSSFKEESG